MSDYISRGGALIDKAVRAKMEINRGREWRHGK